MVSLDKCEGLKHRFIFIHLEPTVRSISRAIMMKLHLSISISMFLIWCSTGLRSSDSLGQWRTSLCLEKCLLCFYSLLWAIIHLIGSGGFGWIWAENTLFTSQLILLLSNHVINDPLPLAATHAHTRTSTVFDRWCRTLSFSFLSFSLRYKLILVSDVKRSRLQICEGSLRCFLAKCNQFAPCCISIHMLPQECSRLGSMLWRCFS